MNVGLCVALAAAFWYAAEAFLAFVAGWPLTWRSPFAWILRDALLPFLWGKAWTGDAIVWRGNAMNVEETVVSEASSGPQQHM